MVPAPSFERGMRRGRPAGASIAFVLAFLAGCGPRAASPAEALDALEPHLRAFEEFDAWARATLAAEPADPRSSAFREVLFSPLQSDAGVVAAWVVREGAESRSWELVDVASPATSALFANVATPRIGTLRIAFADLDDSRPRSSTRVRTVLVSRRARTSASATVEVTVAYAR